MNYQIQTLNAISPAIYTQLGEHYHVSDHAEQPDAILVRSASMHDLPLAPSVLCIARAGAGTNNIPIDACTQAGVCVFNTPGANANAVKELKAGRVDFKVDKAGVLHAPLGKVSFGPEKILGNLKALVETVNRLKPSAAKGTYMKNMAVSTTMGPGFKVDMALVKKFIEG